MTKQGRYYDNFWSFLTAGPLGVLEFTVNYLKDIKRLDVHIHDAKVL